MPKGIFKRHLDISSVLLPVIQVALPTPLGLCSLWRLCILYITGRKKQPYLQLLPASHQKLAINLKKSWLPNCYCTFQHIPFFSSEGTKTMLPVNAKHLKAQSWIRGIFTETQEIPATYVFYQMDTNYHALNSKLAVVLMPHHTTTSEMWAAPHRAWCHDQDDLPVAQHCAMGSCSGCWGMCLLKKHLPLQANPKIGCVPYLMSSSGFPQWTPRAFLPEAAADDSHTAWQE